jgi:hypothetical protein
MVSCFTASAHQERRGKRNDGEQGVGLICQPRGDIADASAEHRGGFFQASFAKSALHSRKARNGKQQRQRVRPADRPRGGNLGGRQQDDYQRGRGRFDVRPILLAKHLPQGESHHRE